jgi:hypothetical protein
MSAATPRNIFRSFKRSGLSLIGDQVLLGQVWSATASRLLDPIASEFPRVDESDQATTDDVEELLLAEEDAELVFNLDSD